MRVESIDPKDLRAAKVAITRLAKRRAVPIVYQALTNGFAVLPTVLADEAASTSAATLVRRRRTRHQDEKASGT